MKRWLKTFLLLCGIGAIAFTYLAVRAHRNLVTLDVRDMEVREVVGKIEWQTWEDIFVQKDVSGKVTLKVNKMPLDDVLEIIAEQTSSRWTAIYPIYSSRKNLPALKKALLGDISSSESGWKNLGGGSFMMASMFAATAQDQNKLVTLKLENKDLDVAAQTLSRYSRARVVCENGDTKKVSLSLSETSFSEAVEELAKKARRDWTKYYALQTGRRRPPEERMARSNISEEQNTNTPSTDSTTSTTSTTSTNAEPAPWERQFSEQDREEMRKRFEAALETMTPEERQRAEQMRKTFEEMRNLPPEERRKRFAEMASRPEMQTRMQNRMASSIKNTTPEQRVERDQRFLQRRRQSGR